ncbi:MAG: hypothetical protein Q7V19_00010, partial [Bacteroidales bacterium]|nr:hypothetical protein [Bacteroidales bacterium]
MNEEIKGKGTESFLPRGCCRAPRVYNPKDHIYQHQCCKLDTHNWLKDYESPSTKNALLIAEVRFKNDHKEFFSYTPDIELKEGEIVAVEAAAGHDLGVVTLTGNIVDIQMKRKKA